MRWPERVGFGSQHAGALAGEQLGGAVAVDNREHRPFPRPAARGQPGGARSQGGDHDPAEPPGDQSASTAGARVVGMHVHRVAPRVACGAAAMATDSPNSPSRSRRASAARARTGPAGTSPRTAVPADHGVLCPFLPGRAFSLAAIARTPCGRAPVRRPSSAVRQQDQQARVRRRPPHRRRPGRRAARGSSPARRLPRRRRRWWLGPAPPRRRRTPGGVGGGS